MKDVILGHQLLLKHTKTIYFSIFFEDFFLFLYKKREEDEKEKNKT